MMKMRMTMPHCDHDTVEEDCRQRDDDKEVHEADHGDDETESFIRIL